MELSKLHEELITKLECLYGSFDHETFRFEKASNAKISRELGYSDAQFSRLMHQSASEGEFQRAIQNVGRILLIQELQEKLNNKDKTANVWFTGSSRLLLLIFAVVAVIALSLLISGREEGELRDLDRAFPKDHTLEWAFESSFINPYVKLNDLPADCQYPCYKYQGKWELNNTYKLPFFRERSGFHYLATSVNMYARCMIEKNENGNIIEGYEYQKHEIWYDKKEWPIDSFLTPQSELIEAYKTLDFNDDKNFVKVANVHTFFRNEFYLDSLIHRTGKVIGRDLEFVPIEQLKNEIDSEKILNRVQSELNQIVSNRLEDFSTPINCEVTPLIQEDFNLVKEEDTMSFSCQLTTGRFPIDYTKTYVLADQYIKNRCMADIRPD